MHQKLEEVRKHSSLETSEETWPNGHLDFGLLASSPVREYFHCFKSPGLWSSVLAALEN